MGVASRRESFRIHERLVHNVVVEFPGESPELIVIGAHYDTNFHTPGANDNGTGVAALLEIARSLKSRKRSIGLRLVAFANEEQPFLKTAFMGSLVHAKRSRERGDKIRGMLSLETIGVYSNKKGSQKYPFPFNLILDSRGDFTAFIGNLDSGDFQRRCIRAYAAHASVRWKGALLPAWFTGASLSDHWAFHQYYYPAVMVTDTAPFRYRQYHTPGDTPAIINYPVLTRVVLGLMEMTARLTAASK